MLNVKVAGYLWDGTELTNTNCTRVKAGRRRGQTVARNCLKHQRIARFLSRFLRRKHLPTTHRLSAM